MNKRDLERMQSLYETRFSEYGYDPRTLGWYKGKQKMRFSILTERFDLSDKSILDIGCGFGDLNCFLKDRCTSYAYTGVDCVESLIAEAEKRHHNENAEFHLGNFLELELGEFDYIVASGIFNFKLDNEDNYEYTKKVMEKCWRTSRHGVALDFLSDKVDFIKYEQTFHSNPSVILDFAFGLTRNVVLRNDYAPFEFSVIMFHDERFSPEDTIFSRYKEAHPEGY